MNDLSEPVPPASAAPSGTDAGTVRYSVPEVARVLGISERAVRKRITAGQLDAHKEGNAWVVLLPATMGAVPAAPAAPGAAPESGTTGGTVDVTPLAELIANLTRENQELAAAASVWQYRALRAEETVAALQAGPVAGDVQDGPQDAPQDANPGSQSGDWQEVAPGGLLGRLWRLIGRS